MELLKYLDVLIGFAIVMVFLSPMVSAITQAWMWVFCTRAGRLQEALKNLLLQLQGSGFERFGAITVSGYAPGQKVSLNADGCAAVSAVADGNGVVRFEQRVSDFLKAGKGNVSFNPALPVGGAAMALASGPVGGWRIQSGATDATGKITVAYEFPGAAGFASSKAAVTLAAGAVLQARIVSGPYSGTSLTVQPGTPMTVTYPDTVKPVPNSHELELTVTDARGAAVADAVVTLEFERNAAFDAALPLGAATTINEDQAQEIARQALLHPMVAQPTFLQLTHGLFANRRRGEVVEREEFIRILLEFAAGEGSGGKNLSAGARSVLQGLLRDNGIGNAAAALTKIRALSQAFEKDDPSEKASSRLTKAMLIGTPSDFLGKLTTWFDPMMYRTSAEYKFRAQLVTVMGALLVAFVVQVDSFDLLKRLSTDSALRDSLVKEADEEAKRADTETQNKDSVGAEQAKERLREIEENLARLREPQMSALPQRFLWQASVKARLGDDSHAMTVPYPERLDLVAGGNFYTLQPIWRGDPMAALQAAIEGSGAAVKAKYDQKAEIEFAGDDLKSFEVTVDGVRRLIRDRPVARVRLTASPAANEKLALRAGYYDVQEVKSDDKGNIVEAVNASKLPLGAEADGKITAKDANIYWIELRRNGKDGPNILGKPDFVVQRAVMSTEGLASAKACQVRTIPVECNADKIAEAARAEKLEAKMHSYLTLSTRLNPPLELLTSQDGKAGENLLTPVDQGWELDLSWMGGSAVGVVVTWMLLSLGAPFWYDALKDLLKLRSGLAKTEEDARNSRVSEAGAGQKKGS